MSILFKRIKDWAVSIIAFRTGDLIPVDGPSGTAKMSKDYLLKETADNANSEFYHFVKPSFVVGSIDPQTGENVNYALSLRSGYIAKENAAIIFPPNGYFVRAVAYYNSNSIPPNPNDFVSMDIFEYNAAKNFESVKSTTNFYRIILKTIDGSDAEVDDADDSNFIKLESFYERLQESIGFLESVNSNPSFVKGSIDILTGEDVIWNLSLRSGYIPKEYASVIFPPNGYFVRAIAYYTSDAIPPGSSNFVSMDIFEYNETKNFETAKSTENFYRIILNTIDGSESDTDDASSTKLIDLGSAVGQIYRLESFYEKLEDSIEFLGETNANHSFVKGSIDTQTGEDVNYALSLRSGYIPKEKASVIFPPDGYFVRAIAYYSSDSIPPGSSNFVSMDIFEYNAAKNFETAKSTTNFYRIILKTIDGSDAEVDDAFTLKLVDLESVVGQLYKYDLSSPTNGLKFVVTGDSIPHGQVMDGTPPNNPYPNIVATALGMSLKNYAIGGSTFAQSSTFGGLYASYADFVAAQDKDTSKIYVVMTGQQTYKDYAYTNGAWAETQQRERTPISARFQLMDDDADLVLVACGTNDFQYNWTPIGTMEDRTPDTFYGALHYTILGLLDKYLSKQIIFCTPIKRCQSPYSSVTSTNTYGKTLEDYGAIIKEVCSYYSIPVIDLYAESGLNPQVPNQSSLFDSYKTHPYQLGHNMIARVVAGKIKSLRGTAT